MSLVTVIDGASPLVLSQPHVGTALPPEVTVALGDLGRSVPDTDWWIDELYAPLAERFAATVVRQGWSRYVIDVNRDPTGASLYPGRTTTGLVPLETFDGEPIWRPGAEPDAAEIARRRRLFFEPYHAALAGAVEATRIRHGFCVLWDCHSIRSRIPRLFEGELPELNLGTNDGAACAPELRAAARAVLERCGRSFVVDGRFKGGWITRHYGRPEQSVHALQMELAQRSYLAAESPPWPFDPTRAAALRDVLAHLIEAVLEAARRRRGSGVRS